MVTGTTACIYLYTDCRYIEPEACVCVCVCLHVRVSHVCIICFGRPQWKYDMYVCYL